MYMTGIAALVSTLVMSPVAAAVTPLSCIPAGVTRSAGFRLDLDTNTFARPIIHPNAAETGPTDINNGGRIVGAYQDQGGTTHGFLQDGSTTRSIDIDKPGVVGTFVTDINDAGEMVGVYRVGNVLHGFRMDGPAVTYLDDVSGATATVPFAINNGGDVVGTYVDGSGQHGFVILGGTLTTRDDIIAAYGINDRREVVGIFWEQ